MTNLSEDIVKKIALQFLKGYYKYRPRGEGDTIARTDVVAPGGIMADGHLTFNKEDGSLFLATFEATANDTREEVVFHQLPVLRNWDALAAGSAMGVLVLGFLYVEKWKWFPIMGKYLAVFVGLFVGIGFFYLVHYLLRGLHRYRYIYAIEQFKRYYADQQWVALAEDVFTDPNDKYLKELKDQCIKQGFGLLVIDQNEKAHLIITPARVQAMKKRRRLVQFEDAQAWTRRMTERLKPENPIQIPIFKKWSDTFQWPSWMHRVKGRMPDFSISRFQRSYFNQILIVVASVVASAAILYDLYRIPPVRYPDEDAYMEELELLTQTTQRETGEYLIDTPFLEQYNKVPKSPNPMADEPSQTVKPPVDTVMVAPETLIPGLGPPPPPPPKPKTERAKPSTINPYDCDRFYGIKGSRYLVLYGLVEEEALARRKLDTLYNAGIEGGIVWMGCFETQSGAFAVYLGTFFNTPEEAASQKTKLEIILQEEGVKAPPLKLRPLVFKSGG